MAKTYGNWSDILVRLVIAGASDAELKAAIIESQKAIDKSKEEK